MTREEATEILDPETNKAALVRYDDDEARLEACNEACRIAAAVLRERKGQRTEELPGWLDNADSYVCAYCGFEVDNPNRLPGGPWRCPRCGADMGRVHRPVDKTRPAGYRSPDGPRRKNNIQSKLPVV